MFRFSPLAWCAMLIVLLTSLTPGGPAFAQAASSPSERFFKLEWQVERRDGDQVAITGHLRNDYLYSIRRLQLQVQGIDANGRVTDETVAAVGRDLRPGESTTFRIPVRTVASRYAVLVYAFEFGERGESP